MVVCPYIYLRHSLAGLHEITIIKNGQIVAGQRHLHMLMFDLTHIIKKVIVKCILLIIAKQKMHYISLWLSLEQAYLCNMQCL